MQGPKLLRKDSPMPEYEEAETKKIEESSSKASAKDIGNSDFKVKSIEYEIENS